MCEKNNAQWSDATASRFRVFGTAPFKMISRYHTPCRSTLQSTNISCRAFNGLLKASFKLSGKTLARLLHLLDNIQITAIYFASISPKVGVWDLSPTPPSVFIAYTFGGAAPSNNRIRSFHGSYNLKRISSSRKGSILWDVCAAVPHMKDKHSTRSAVLGRRRGFARCCYRSRGKKKKNDLICTIKGSQSPIARSVPSGHLFFFPAVWGLEAAAKDFIYVSLTDGLFYAQDTLLTRVFCLHRCTRPV